QRRMVGEQGIYRVWAFRPEVPALWFGNCTIPAGVNHLVTQGLLTYVPHLWENESDEAELLHGYGTCEGGEPMEVEMGRAAHRAALAMVPEFKLRDAIAEGFSDLAPVANTFPNVQMVGVPRLRYRPHTTR